MISSARTARIAREVKNFATKPPWGITCQAEKEEVYDTLLVTLLGPKGSPYEKGTFKLVITIPQRYPFEPPLVKFTTPIYHPNIDKGNVDIFSLNNLNIYLIMLFIHVCKYELYLLTSWKTSCCSASG